MPGFNITGGADGPRPTTETARSHRWEVWVMPSNPDTVRFYAKSVTRPSIEFDTIVMHHRSNEIKLPGKSRTSTCNLVLYERIADDSDDTAEFARTWWSQWLMDAKNFSLTMTGSAGGAGGSIANCKRQLQILMLDGCGNTAWTYILNGVFPTKVTPSELDYCQTEISTIEITLSVDAFEEGQSL